MAGGLSYESWTDAPIGMQAAQADKIIERFRNASSQVGSVMKETPQPKPVAVPVRPIDANSIKYWEHTECYGHGDYERVRTVTYEEIAKMPTLDVAEVVHGRWEWLGPYRYNNDGIIGTCSACKERLRLFATNYCPNCGAKMDGE